REHERAQNGKAEARKIRLPGIQLEPEEKGAGGAQSGDLGERDVHEDHLSAQDMKAKIGMDAGEHEAHQERHPHQGEQIAPHVYPISLWLNKMTSGPGRLP